MKLLSTKFALPIALSAMTLTTCCKPINADGLNSIEEQTIENAIPMTNNRGGWLHIGKEYIQYMNLDGKVVNVKITNEATTALYKGVQKYSNNLQDDITDICGFYAEVESHIPKDNKANHVDILINKTLASANFSNFFNKLFDLFTSPKSDKGETITVREYTQMMDAWSSTGKKAK